MQEEINHIEFIENIIKRKQPFALFRAPGEKAPRFLTQTNGGVRLMNDITELNGQKGFVIAPFRITKECPVVLIQPDVMEEAFFLPGKEQTERKGERTISESAPDSDRFKEYSNGFSAFIQALQNGTFDKLVLSRSLTLDKSASFSPVDAFMEACRRYIYSYVYLCYTPQTGYWIGGTPEILLAGAEEEWHTVALAGTQPLQNGELPLEWDEKNRKEQDYVVSYIRSQLRSLGVDPVEKGPYPAYAGALSHLKTDFYFSLNKNTGLGDILKLLHPTPAVCGLPKEEAYRFILQKEGYDRKYYSGFIGWLHPEGRTELYVNLRCMHIEENQLTLYAGGGILASSRLEEEWQETENKLQTMQRLITH